MKTPKAIAARSAGRFPYDAARNRAERLGLSVVSVCHASLPPGVPCRDHWDNYVTAETVYIGAPGTPEKLCAYGRSVHSIHQQATPGLAEALRDICDALAVMDSFTSRAEYVDYYLGPNVGRCPAHQIDQMAQAWRDYQCTAHRAVRCLPPELVAWLRSLYQEA